VKPKYIISLVLILLVVIVLVQNTQIVDFQILFWKVSMSRSIFLAVNVLVGVALGISLRLKKKKTDKNPPPA
jgi:uncharacterized integral membrane protein